MYHVAWFGLHDEKYHVTVIQVIRFSMTVVCVCIRQLVLKIRVALGISAHPPHMAHYSALQCNHDTVNGRYSKGSFC